MYTPNTPPNTLHTPHKHPIHRPSQSRMIPLPPSAGKCGTYAYDSVNCSPPPAIPQALGFT